MSSRFEEEGIPDPGDLTPEQEATGQLDLTTEPPHDSPLAVEGWGTTAEEQREGPRRNKQVPREHEGHACGQHWQTSQDEGVTPQLPGLPKVELEALDPSFDL